MSEIRDAAYWDAFIPSQLAKKPLKPLLDSVKLPGKEVFEELYENLRFNKHTLLYGRGGFGKSFMIRQFLLYFDLLPHTYKLECSIGTRESNVKGPMSLKALMERDKLEYKLEDGFLGFPIAYFEEALDMPANVATMLKAFSDGHTKNTTNGGVLWEFPLRVIIAATNISPDEFIESATGRERNSNEALISRFETYQVEWKSADYTMPNITTVITGSFPSATKQQVIYASKLAMECVHKNIYPSMRDMEKIAHTIINKSNSLKSLEKMMINGNREAGKLLMRRQAQVLTEAAAELKVMETFLKFQEDMENFTNELRKTRDAVYLQKIIAMKDVAKKVQLTDQMIADYYNPFIQSIDTLQTKIARNEQF